LYSYLVRLPEFKGTKSRMRHRLARALEYALGRVAAAHAARPQAVLGRPLPADEDQVRLVF